MLGPLIGRGNTADVFDAGRHQVVKLFHAGYPLHSVRREFENARLLRGLDIPIVRGHELIEYDGRYGIVYDKIDGTPMQHLLLQSGDVEKYAAMLAVLHRRVLACTASGAISIKSIWRTNIERTRLLHSNYKLNVLAMLDRLPDGTAVCHGDFHFGNVIVEQESVHVIDYMNVCRGHEYADIARTVYLVEMTPVPDSFSDKERIGSIKTRATEVYLHEMGVARAELSEWLVVTAAARLAELAAGQTDEADSVMEYISMHANG